MARAAGETQMIIINIREVYQQRCLVSMLNMRKEFGKIVENCKSKSTQLGRLSQLST